ncbi:MAG: ATP-binding protein [Nitrospirales bacterium]|nr:ATP-binding protein [Nitrospirales bacterium]
MESLPSLLCLGLSLIVGGALVWKRRNAPLLFRLLPVMVVVFWIHGINWYSHFNRNDWLWWHQLLLIGELAFPLALGSVSQSFCRTLDAASPSKDQWWWRSMAGMAILLMGVVTFFPDSVLKQNPQGKMIFVRASGLAIWSFILIALIVALSHMERIFHSLRDPFRHQFKFVFFGLVGLAGMSIAQATQMLLLPIWSPLFVWINGIISAFSLLLVGFGLARWRIKDLRQKVQVSDRALFSSFTVALVGGYLGIVILVDQMLQTTRWPMTEALRVLVLFVAALCLVFVVGSRQVRLRLRSFLARHFLRAKYDYRQKWLEVTEKFSVCHDMQEVWDRYLEWLEQTFAASHISIWKRFEADGQFHQIRSLSAKCSPPIPDTHKLIQELNRRRGPFFLHQYGLHAEALGNFGEDTQAYVCVPILRKKGVVLGFCTLSRDFDGQRYDHDDFNLLWVMAHHVAMLLLQFQLQEERNSSAKWEAVHRFSAFYLHDLKNLAGSLSLVVQNAQQYGANPEFQDSAMSTVKITTQRIMELMGKLACQTKAPTGKSSDTMTSLDINELVRETIRGIPGPGCKPVFHAGIDIPPVRLQHESIKQVILNLILNARQAMGEHGTLDIFTKTLGQEVIVEVVDAGPGMTSAQLEHLFEPFRSSKKTGLGIGLYQCKRIIEEQEGYIRVESLLGQGTKIIVTFPVEITDTVTV